MEKQIYQQREEHNKKIVAALEKQAKVLSGVNTIVGKDGYTPLPDVDYPSIPTIEKKITEITPKKGVEYFTQDEINSIIKDVLSKINESFEEDITKEVVSRIDIPKVDYAYIEKCLKDEIAKIPKPEIPENEEVIVDYDSIVKEVLTKIPKPKPAEKIDYEAIKKECANMIERMEHSRPRLNSGGPTTRLEEILDVDLEGLTINQSIKWNGTAWVPYTPGGGGGGHTIEDEGTPLTQRTKLNFVGVGVTVTDDAGDDATVVTITGGGGSSGGSFTQAFTSQTSVVVTHNLGAYPVVDILDSGLAVIIPLNIIHSSVNAFTVTFTASTTGTVVATLGVGTGGGGGGTWGSITGTLSAQTDLQTALDLKANLISPSFTTPTLGVATATTINGATITSGTLNGSVTGTNTGDNATNTQYSGLVSNATHTGDATGATALTIANNAVTNAKSAQMATKTYKGRTSALTGNAEDVPVATLKTDLVLVKGDVGLGNVDNTADTAKPVSTAQQTALDLKANLASPSFTGTVTMTYGIGSIPTTIDQNGVSTLIFNVDDGSGLYSPGDYNIGAGGPLADYGIQAFSNNVSGIAFTVMAETGWGAIFNTVNLTDDRTYHFPDKSGTFAMTSDITGTNSGTNTGDQIISDATITTTDITTNDFSTAKHGFVPKGTNVGNFLKDDGTWAAPAGGGSGIVRSVNSIAVNTTLAATASTDYVYFASTTINATLPTATGNTNRYTVINSGTGIITVVGTISGVTNDVLYSQYETAEYQSDGTNWYKLN